MPYSTKEKKLTIDLSEETYDAKTLLENENIEFIRIDECIEQFELPESLKDYQNLTKFYLSGGNRDVLYPPPVHLEKLTNIRKLTLWSYCDIKKLSPMPHIEALDIVVKDPFTDVQVIASIFPNLKKMEIWGAHFKSGELPPQIGDFKNLEYLELVSCGLTNLPPEFKKLKNLKSLNMRGLVMTTFPEVVCEMEGLESLTFNQHIISLPDNFLNLKALKVLNFSQAFNKGTTSPVDRWSDRPVYLHPIPEVIGKLPSLQELDLSDCGVINLTFLKPLKTLKKLRIRYSGLPNCNELSDFNRLEILNLESAEVLDDISGLAGLPIENLNLKRCDEIASISPINELPALEELNIEGCSDIESLDALYQHSNLKVLKASSDLIKKWEFKEQFKNTPSLDRVIDNLSSKDVVIAEKAMNNLGLHVNKNYHEDNNPLAGYFGEAKDDEVIVNLPALDAAFIKHKDQLNVDTLISLVKMSLGSVIEDNYNIAILSIQEIIKRKDTLAQQQVIAQFKNACASYDFGHRYWGITVHDQLFDDLFPAFESVALIDLLKDGHGDMLNCDGGDGGDLLFAPAFEKCKNNADFEELLTAFFEYQDETLEYQGFQYFTDLHTNILAVLNKDHHAKFTAELEKRNTQTRLFTLLESDDPKDMIKLIEEIGKTEHEAFLKANDHNILAKMNQLELSLDPVTIALNIFIEKKRVSHYIKDVLLKYMLPKGEDAIIAYLKTRENSDIQTFIGKIVSDLIVDLNIKTHPMSDMQVFRVYLKQINQCDDDAIYTLEIESLFEKIKGARFYDDAFYKYLDRFEEIIGLIKSPPIQIKDVRFNLWLMADHAKVEQWSIIKRLCKALFTVISLKDTVNALFIAIISAGMTKDRDFLNFLVQYIPEKIQDELLAYNLACAFSIFSEKEPMLKYVRDSIELGKTKTQFLDDKDFTQYKEDKDFLKVLEREK